MWTYSKFHKKNITRAVAFSIFDPRKNIIISIKIRYLFITHTFTTAERRCPRVNSPVFRGTYTTPFVTTTVFERSFRRTNIFRFSIHSVYRPTGEPRSGSEAGKTLKSNLTRTPNGSHFVRVWTTTVRGVPTRRAHLVITNERRWNLKKKTRLLQW